MQHYTYLTSVKVGDNVKDMCRDAGQLQICVLTQHHPIPVSAVFVCQYLSYILKHL